MTLTHHLSEIMGAILFLLIVALLKGQGAGVTRDINECLNEKNVCRRYSTCIKTVGSYYCQCYSGFRPLGLESCDDIDECVENKHICGEWEICLNLIGSYRCKCSTGFIKYGNRRTPCADINECMADPLICGDNSICLNTNGSYYCECLPGFTLQPRNIPDATGQCLDINECETDGVCGKGGICQNLNGSYCCLCSAGFTNFGKNQTKCVELNCDQYETQPGQTLPGFDSFLSQLRNNCLVLRNSGMSGPTRQPLAGDVLLTLLVNTTDVLQLGLQSNGHRSSSEVTTLLRTVENSIRLIAPLLTEKVTRIETNHTEADIMVRRDKTPPEGPVSLTNENTHLDTTWETAVGDYQNYPGFAFVVLLSYKNLDTLKDSSSHQSQQLLSSAATVSVSNTNTKNLPQLINLTFNHLQSSDVDPTCVYWSDENGQGVWSGRGCTSVTSNSTHTVCSCNHLSTFALLEGIHQKKRSGQLSVVMWVGICVALTCVVLSLITMKFCRFVSRKRLGGHRLQQNIQLHSK